MPKYEPHKWNNDKYTRKSHNCYAYFLNKRSKRIRNKCRNRIRSNRNIKSTIKPMSPYKKFTCRECFRPKPGRAFGKKFTKKNYNCRDVVNRVFLDNKNIKKSSRYAKCPKNHYKGVSIVTKNYFPNVEWFHFARKDSNNKWSHKSGSAPVEPYNLNKIYKDPNKKVCSYFCIPDDSKKLRMKEEREFIDCKNRTSKKTRKSRRRKKMRKTRTSKK